MTSLSGSKCISTDDDVTLSQMQAAVLYPTPSVFSVARACIGGPE